MGDSAKTDAPKGSFWKGVKTELNKIIWPNKEDLLKKLNKRSCLPRPKSVIIM